MTCGYILGGMMVCVEWGRALSYDTGVLRNSISVLVSFVSLHSDEIGVKSSLWIGALKLLQALITNLR